MNLRTFYAGAAVGFIFGALAVIALRTYEKSPATLAHARHITGPDEGSAPAMSSQPSHLAPNSTEPARSEDASVGAESVSSIASREASDLENSSPDPDADILGPYADEWEHALSVGQLTAKLRSESRDEVWASNMESQLRDYLARRPVPNAIGSVRVTCRTSLCRVICVINDQVFESVPNSDLQAAINDLPNESLGHELTFVGLTVGVDPEHDTQTMEMAFLRRTDQPSDFKR